MRFRLLGPLEVESAHDLVPLGGRHQRALLGLLLLHAGEVVETDQLMTALWPQSGGPPPSARKMVHNAVSGLRRSLARSTGGGRSPAILRRKPGYVLMVAPETVDALRFGELARLGQSRVAEGATVAGIALLREALALWRGPVLTDLKGAAVHWPETAVLENARLDCLECRFDAELRMGHHQVVLRELLSVASAEPSRERLRSLLMLALYRSGRQLDALELYRTTRANLLQDHGVEPGEDLRTMHRAILAQDPRLLGTEHTTRTAAPALPGPSPTESRPPRPSADAAAVAQVVVERAGPAHDGESTPIDRLVQLGGRPLPSPAVDVCVAEFRSAPGLPGCQETAVRAALTLVSLSQDGRSSASSGGRPLRVHVSTKTPHDDFEGWTHPHGPLATTAWGTVRVCDRTREATGGVVRYHHGSGGEDEWTATGVRDEHTGSGLPALGREEDIEVLRHMLRRAHRSRHAHLATVLGPPGVGRTRLTREVCGRVSADLDDVSQFVVRMPPVGEEPTAETAARGQSAQPAARAAGPGRPGATPSTVALARLLGAVDDEISCSRSALPPGAAPARRGLDRPPDHLDMATLLVALRRSVVALAQTRPVLLVVEDVHGAQDSVLDALEEVGSCAARIPLLVVATATPRLLERRPTWSGGASRALSLTLAPLPATACARLARLMAVRAEARPDARDAALSTAARPGIRWEDVLRLLGAGAWPPPVSAPWAAPEVTP